MKLAVCFTFLVTAVLGSVSYKHSVKVVHFLLSHWGESRNGLQDCGDIACDWVNSEHIKQLRDDIYFTTPRDGLETITVSMYNIHSLYERLRILHPLHCELKTNLTMAETEESRVRYGYIFDPGFANFDGYSSTSPDAAVQRVYIESFMDNSTFLPIQNFSSLIKAATYVASDCHRHDSANADRDSIVRLIRGEGFRVDGLGTMTFQHKSISVVLA